MEESLLGNEKLPWNGLDQKQGHKDDKESAIMLFVVAPNYVCFKYCTCSFQILICNNLPCYFFLPILSSNN